MELITSLGADWIADLGEALGRFHFMRPLWLLAVPLLLGLAAGLARRRSTDGSWGALIDGPLLDALRLPEPPASRATPWPWLAAVWTLTAVALAGPTWQREPATAYSAPDGWVLVLDLSPSMAARDVAPDRITRARYVIDDVLRAAQGARIGVVVFSDEPYTVTPLTDDMATVRGLTGALSPDLMPSRGDQLAGALTTARQLLERATITGGHVVVLTDGCADPEAALAAADRLRARKTPVDVVGIGTPAGATWPRAGGGVELDAEGQPKRATLDRPLLQRLAGAGGGRVFGLDELPALVAGLQSRTTGPATALAGLPAARWRDAGVWLLPLVLLLAVPLARRGAW